MSSRLFPPGLLAVALLAGCGGGGATSPAPNPSATVNLSSAAAALDDLVWALRAKVTGTFTETRGCARPQGTEELNGSEYVKGSYDLRAQAWASERDCAGDENLPRHGTVSRGIGATVYSQNLPEGKEAEKKEPWTYRPGLGRRTERPLTASFGTTTLPTPLVLLTQIAVTGAGPAPDGGSTITGTVPAPYALRAAGVDGWMGRKVDEVGGTATAKILVGADGLPSTLTLDFAGIDTSAATFSASGSRDLTRTDYRATFADLGSVVRIARPKNPVYLAPPTSSSSDKSADPTEGKV